jgi:hypothetical protein
MLWLGTKKVVYYSMSGEDIIERVNEIKELIIRNPDGGDLALKYCDYLIDDIYLYRKQCL